MATGNRIIVQKQDEQAQWSDLLVRHCTRINKTNSTKSSEYFEAGAEHTASPLTFEMRWSKKIEPIRFDTSSYRIVYRGQPFDITGYDDFEERHQTVKITGVSYGG